MNSPCQSERTSSWVLWLRLFLIWNCSTRILAVTNEEYATSNQARSLTHSQEEIDFWREFIENFDLGETAFSIPPTGAPSHAPSTTPSNLPTPQSSSQMPTKALSTYPTQTPSENPTVSQSDRLSIDPTFSPTGIPSKVPTLWPSMAGSVFPTNIPSLVPTIRLSESPSSTPSSYPSALPSFTPTNTPTIQMSHAPSTLPSSKASNSPTSMPSVRERNSPSIVPSQNPTTSPTQKPSQSPSSRPTTSSAPSLPCESSCGSFSGSLGFASSVSTGTLNTQSQQGSTCSNQKSFPGVAFSDLQSPFHVFGPFCNDKPVPLCMTINVDLGSCNFFNFFQGLNVAAYETEFDSADLAPGYMGDLGDLLGSSTGSFEVAIPQGGKVLLVALYTNLVPGSFQPCDFAIAVDNDDCRAPSLGPSFEPTSDAPSEIPSTLPTIGISPSSVPSSTQQTATPTEHLSSMPSTDTAPTIPSDLPTTKLPTLTPSSKPSYAPSPPPSFADSCKSIERTFANTGQFTSGRLRRNGIQSTCDAPKPYPLRFGSDFRGFNIIGPFQNAFNESRCATLSWDFGTCFFQNQTAGIFDILIHPSVYSPSFDPTDMSLGYLADNGSSELANFSFVVPAMTEFVFVAQEVIYNDHTPQGEAFGCDYAVEVVFDDTVCESASMAILDMDSVSLPPCGQMEIPWVFLDNGQTMNGRMRRDGTICTCESVKDFPGKYGNSERNFNILGPFQINASIDQCVTIQWDFGTCTTNEEVLIHPSAYTHFDPTNMKEGYLGDPATSDAESFGFVLPRGSEFIIVAQAVESSELAIGCSFTVSIGFESCSERTSVKSIINGSTLHETSSLCLNTGCTDNEYYGSHEMMHGRGGHDSAGSGLDRNSLKLSNPSDSTESGRYRVRGKIDGN